MRLSLVACLTLLIAAGALAAPLSKRAALKLMHDRHENMEAIGKAVRTARRTLQSSSPDLTAIRTSAATIADFAPKVRTWFPAGTGPDVGKTMAKREIWQNPKDFSQKLRDWESAAVTFNAAAKSGDLQRINGAYAGLGKTCNACHDSYRNEHEH
jgi:cytochrome c556